MKKLDDTYWMKEALLFAEKGKLSVRPNPMVGCIIVHQNKIIGTGFHEYFGGPHAEVNAINQVKDKTLLKDSIVYVSLEPCAHFGKTPPCANLLVENKVKKVVIASLDPNPLVAGKGVEILKKARIEVVQGVLEKEAKHLNKRFFYFHQKNKPFITLKYASSKDNKIAKSSGEPIVFSNEISKEKVHELRAVHQAILVGINTIHQDDPNLNTRYSAGPSPIKIVLDPHNRIDKKAKVLTEGEPTWIFNLNQNLIDGKNEWIKVNKDPFLKETLQILSERNIQSILVEGGKITLDHFIQSNQFNEIIHIESNMQLKEGIPGPSIPFKSEKSEKIGEDNTWTYYSTQPNT